MVDNRTGQSSAGDATPREEAQPDPRLEALRGILLEGHRQRIAQLEAEARELERRITDEDALIGTISPVLGDAIRRKIRDAREEMVEALYPIIGQVVVRAVGDAIRDLARAVDARVRTSLTPGVLWWRLRARIGGVSGAEMALRETLPCRILEVFLIHRETGLMLSHVSGGPDVPRDSDLISGMLTAIRDFAEDAFGRGEFEQLDEIQYGDRRILIEAAQHAYLAVVVEGAEPLGFREGMRARIIEIEHRFDGVLRKYNGDATGLAAVEESLRSLMTNVEPHRLSRMQRGVLAALSVVVVLCLATSYLIGRWGWVATRSALAPTVAAPSVTSTAIPSPSPSASAEPTPTVTAAATERPAPSPTLEPVIGVMLGSVWVREGPSSEAPRIGVVFERGKPVEIGAVRGDWVQVHWAGADRAEIVGWVPGQWVGTAESVPERMVTPSLGS